MIWVGDVSPPNYFYENLSGWKQLMPDWEFKIWTNEKINELNIDSSYLKLVEKCNNGAQKSDLLRYYVVNQFGGYYVDADIVPERSLNELNVEDYDLVLCHDLEITWEYIIAAFFAATINSPVLKSAIDDMQNVDLTDKEQHLTVGPGAMGRAYFKNKEKVNSTILPYWYFYRNKIGDIDPAKEGSQYGEYLQENKTGIFGSHRYAATWI